MITDELKYRIRNAFAFTPTTEQEQAIEVFTQFMTDRHEQALMILRGSAGTGKTTLAAAIVKGLLSLQQKIVLLAPTGRAAKVFSLYADYAASTIHRRIYRQKSLEGAFGLNYNNQQDTLFIIDEASMVANASSYSDTPFANGQLLDDLIQYVYNGKNCRMMFIGDSAQLPPEVLRQRLRVDGQSPGMGQESGILWNATEIRSLMYDGSCQLPKVKFEGFSDIHVVPGDELIEQLATSYSRVGMDETMVITRSNKRANIYNQGIRNMVLGREDELCSGDLLMIVKNNYYWTSMPTKSEDDRGSKESCSDPQPTNLGGLGYIANGDRAVVRRVRRVEELYGFRFAEVTMTFPDYDDYELTATVLLDTLTSEAPALTRDQQNELYNQVMADYADIPLKPDRLKKLREDKYYNALQIKFGYAATCHKAQGGQWAHIYIDQGYMTDDLLSVDYIHWLYTAFTRATEQLYLVNWPVNQRE